MTPEGYRSFTTSLAERLAADERVLGLVALGSMAERDYGPDEWSDHDFFVIVRAGEQESMRTDLSWLPRYSDVVLSFRETAHGVKVLYKNGHLLEFAVFDLEEVYLARINRYRVLLDRADVAARMQEVEKATSESARSALEGDQYHFGQLLTNILVGVGRHCRGETLSGAQFVKCSAVRHLVTLIGRHVSSLEASKLDGLDPFRRFGTAHPEIARELERVLCAETLVAAQHLLTLAERELSDAMPADLRRAFEVVHRKLRDCPAAAWMSPHSEGQT